MTNRYLQHNYGPVTQEVTAHDLQVIGTLPPELNGRYLRNGPNPIAEVDQLTQHWFMGDGMVHGVRLNDGKADWYRNRYVGSKQVQTVRGLEDIAGPSSRSFGVGANTNVGGFNGTTWAMVEGGISQVEMTYDLDTVCRNDFYGTLPGAFSAHPKVDPDTGEMHAMTYSWAEWMDHVQYVIVDFDLAFAGRFPFRWQPDYGNRVGLLRREGEAKDIVWVDVPLCALFHPMNAYDTPDGKVVIDICTYEKMFDGDILGPFGDSLPRLERWVIDPVARTSSTTILRTTRPNWPCGMRRISVAVTSPE